jgi:hypothetical protein
MKKRGILIIIIVLSILILGIGLFPTQVHADEFSNVSIWDQKTYSEPKISNGCVVINSANELAWLLKNQDSKGATKVEINCSIDLCGKTFKPFPSTIIELDGNGKTLKNIKVNGNGLFLAKANLNIHDIVVEGANISSKNKSVGVLVGILNGNGTFKNCKIKNCSVSTTKGNAGGMIGYIVRGSEKDRSIRVNVIFDNCSVDGTTISASKAEGKFVGTLSGYDNKETLTFTNCTSASKVNDFKSIYTSANQSTFLTNIDAAYDNFLGAEIYHRGVVTFDGNRFIPKWDGTSVEPLLANTKYDGKGVKAGKNRFVVYSPFDLAGIREITASPSAIYLMESVDMNGQGDDGKFNIPSVFAKSKQKSKDDNAFTPFKTVSTLDGNGHTIYNLSIAELEKSTGAFILSASGKTVHKDINFDSCCTVSTHEKVKTDAKAYGGILIAKAGGSSYTMENVTATDCKVFALQKVGTLAGYLCASKNYAKNCTVENCYIENYKCNIKETFDSGNIKYKDRTFRVKATFYSHGEVGGMFGFIQNAATITNCHVKKTIVNAYGQDDKMATVSGSRLARIAIAAAGYYKVPGRHVGTFIGDIRTTKTVKITNCTVDSQSKCTNRWDKHNSTYKYIGQAYYVKFIDSQGKLTVDGKSLTLADCNKYTKR